MICQNCGKEISEGASFCVSCGACAAGTAPGEGAAFSRRDPAAPNTAGYLVLAILSAVLCFLPTGIPAIVFAAKADGYRSRGMADQTADALRKAKIWTAVSVAVGAVLALAAAVLAFLFAALVAQGVYGAYEVTDFAAFSGMSLDCLNGGNLYVL